MSSLLRRRTPAERLFVTLGLRHHDARKYLVVTRARTGSNLLISSLRSHPQIHAEGELLRRVSGTSVERVLREFYDRSRRRAIAAIGFKMFYYHPLDGDSDAAWSAVEAVDGLHFVHLKRRNRLRTITSRRIADQTKAWVDAGQSAATPRPERKQVTFTRRELVKAFEQGAAFERAFEDRFVTWPMIEVFYEDLVDDLERATNPIMRFLGVADAPVHATTRKQNPEPLSQLIANYDELAHEFSDTPWSVYFDG